MYRNETHPVDCYRAACKRKTLHMLCDWVGFMDALHCFKIMDWIVQI